LPTPTAIVSISPLRCTLAAFIKRAYEYSTNKGGIMLKQILIFITGLSLVGGVFAAQDSKVDYSADYSMETADMTMQGKIYSSPGMERREFDQGGDKMITILRHDKKVVWTLMPEDKAYMETKLSNGGGRNDDISSYKMQKTDVGAETVNGVKTAKAKVIMTGPDGVKMGGFIWTSKEGITVKVDTISADKNSKARFKFELKNLKVAKQDKALFSIPAGYSKMDMGNLGQMMNGGGADDDQSQDKEEGDGSIPKNIMDMLK
jgi:hypothetical protein